MPDTQQRAITIRAALGHGAVALVSDGTAYSRQHVSRILGGHRPQPFVLAWALGRAGLPFDDTLVAPRVAGFRVAVRRAFAAGQRGRAIDGPALWARWKAVVPLWPVVEGGNTEPHQTRRDLMGRGGGSGTVAGARPPENTARRARAQAHHTRGG